MFRKTWSEICTMTSKSPNTGQVSCDSLLSMAFVYQLRYCVPIVNANEWNVNMDVINALTSLAL